MNFAQQAAVSTLFVMRGLTLKIRKYMDLILVIST